LLQISEWLSAVLLALCVDFFGNGVGYWLALHQAFSVWDAIQPSMSEWVTLPA
jgi:hypothetical protein